MPSMARGFRSRTFHRFLLSYCLLLLLPLVFGWVAYSRAIVLLRESEIESSLFQLEKARENLDGQLLDVRRFADRILEDPYIRTFAVVPAPGGDEFLNFDVYKLLEHASGYRVGSLFLDSFYLKFARSAVVITGDSNYHTIALSRSGLDYPGLTKADCEALFRDFPRNRDFLPVDLSTRAAGLPRVILYIRDFPEGEAAPPLVSVAALIDERTIRRLLGGISPYGIAALAAPDGRFFAATPSDAGLAALDLPGGEGSGTIAYRSGRQRMIASYTRSQILDWRIVSASPEARVIGRTRSMLFFMIGLSFLVAVTGILSAVYLSARNTRPIRSLVRLVGGEAASADRPGVDEYGYVETKVGEILEANKHLQKSMEEQIPMLRSVFFERLVAGRYAEEAVIREVSSQLGMELRGRRFSAVLATVGGPDPDPAGIPLTEIIRAKAIIKAVIDRTWEKGRVYVNDRSETEIVLLVGLASEGSAGEREELSALLEDLYRTLREGYRISVSFHAGRPCGCLSEIANSYRECLLAAAVPHDGRGFRLAWYAPAKDGGFDYPYRSDVEERLINGVLSGKRAEVDRELERMYRKEIEGQRHPPEVLALVAADMRCSAVKALGHLHAADRESVRRLLEEIDRLSGISDFRAAFAGVKDVLRSICGLVDAQRRSRQTALIAEMKAYITAHMENLALNRYMVATDFGMNETYFSSFFHEHSGETFSDFLEKARIQRALVFMADPSVTFVEVSRKIGYSSDKVFRRAFKRVTGASPRLYRERAGAGRRSTQGGSVRPSAISTRVGSDTETWGP